MANDKAFRIKNGLSATRYLLSNGVETAGSETYSLSAASYDSKSFSVASQDTIPFDLYFKPDGTKLYVVGSSLDRVYQYTLSTAWDVSTASYDSISFSVSGQTVDPYGMTFNSTGTKMYVLGNDTDTIYQYTLSTPWNIGTASYDSVTLNVNSVDAAPLGITVGNNDTKLYLLGGVADSVFQYSMSVASDLSTASYESKSFSVSAQYGSPYGIAFNSDGTKFYVCGLSSPINQYTLNTAWDVSTANYDGVSFDASSQETSLTSLSFKTDGTKLYAIGTTTDTIYQYSTVSYTQTLDLSTGNYFSFTPSGATTVSFTNAPASGLAVGFSVEVVGNGSAITWPASVKWHLATVPTATATKELYTFVTTDGGTTYYGKKAAEGLA